MGDQTPQQPARQRTAGERVRSFIGWAFVISLGLHAIALPFLHLKGASRDKQEVEKVSVTKKIRVVVPTPPPPTPTPPPPTPPPKSTPPPVKQTNPPPVPKLKVQPPKTTSVSKSASSEQKYVAPKVGSENGVPQGNAATGVPAPVAKTGPPATPAPTPVAPTPTPKPQCAVPNAPAAIKGQAVEPDYPDIARQQGAVGTTNVKVTLDPTGSVTDVSVYKSAGNASLDQAALKAARATAYSPDVVNCVKTAGSYIFQADFTGQ